MSEPTVEFGISNVYYSKITYGENNAITYATPVAIPGAVTLSIEDSGSQNVFYADNIGYFTTSVTSGKSGTLTIARATKQFMKDCLGYVEDANGMLIQLAGSTHKPFALLYQVESDADEIKFSLYNITLGNPSQDHNTQTDSTDPDTQAYEFTAIATEFTVAGEKENVLGAVCEKNATTHTQQGTGIWDTWFTSVVIPTAVSA